ncbi:bromodomain-containing protein [Toxoplasma gondii MAS]|uniref:Bromodomain-containing protein n=1 Tax=Toxoplasma gondii MAS TaxID=943118 RepID=A0A086PYL9_TOXGO|nr:bromodomain-containing protein [Toxoplasma gondii MAS]
MSSVTASPPPLPAKAPGPEVSGDSTCSPPLHAASKAAPSSLRGDVTASGTASRYLQSGDKERRSCTGRGVALPEATAGSQEAEAGTASPLSPAASSPEFLVPRMATSSVSTTGEAFASSSGTVKASDSLDSSCRTSTSSSAESATPLPSASADASPSAFSSSPTLETGKGDASQHMSAVHGAHMLPPDYRTAVDRVVLAEVLHGFDCVRGELFLNEEEKHSIQRVLQPFNFRFVPVVSKSQAAGPGGRRGFSSKRSASGAGPSRRLTQEVQRLQEAACSFAALPRGKRRQSKANSRYQDDDTSSAVGDRVGDSEASAGPSGNSRSADGAEGGSQFLSGGDFWMGPHAPHTAASPGSGGEKTVSVVSDDASTVSRSSRVGGKGEGRRGGGRRSRHHGGAGEGRNKWGGASGRGKGDDADHCDSLDDGRSATTLSGRGRKRKVRHERYDVLAEQGWDEDEKDDHKLRRTSRTTKGGEAGLSSGASTAASGSERIVFTPILRSTPWRESCMLILQHLKRYTAARWFLASVDPELDGVPGYLDVVSRPMDFGTIEQKLRAGPRVYIHPSQWQQDVRQVFFNAFSFHPVNHDVWQDAVILAAEFERCCRQTDQVNPYFTPAMAPSGTGGQQGDGSDRSAFSNGNAEPNGAAAFASAVSGGASGAGRAAGGRWAGASPYTPYYGVSASAPAAQAVHENSWGSSSDVGADASASTAGRSGRGRARRQQAQPFETSAHVSDPYYGSGYGGTASATSGRGRGRGAGASGVGSPRRRGRGRGAAAQLLQRCHTWGEMSKSGPFLGGHQAGGRGGRAGVAMGAAFGGMCPYGAGAPGVGHGGVPGTQVGMNANAVDAQQAYMELDAPPNAPVLPPPPVPRIGVNDKPLSASQKRVLEQNMTRLSSLQRKAALELIQDDLGILAAEYMDEKEFAFDTELLSIEKQKRLFAYVNSMVRANRELWRQQQEAVNLADPSFRAHGAVGPVAVAGVSPYPPAVGDGAPSAVGKGHQGGRRGKKKRDDRSGQGVRGDDSDSSSSDSDSSCSSSSSSFSDSSSVSSSDSDDSDDTDDEKTDASAAEKKQVYPSPAISVENSSAKPSNQEGSAASREIEVNSPRASGPGSSHPTAGPAVGAGLPSSVAVGARDGAELAAPVGNGSVDNSGRHGHGPVVYPTEAGPKTGNERESHTPLPRGDGERKGEEVAALGLSKDEALPTQDGRRDDLDGEHREEGEVEAAGNTGREEGRIAENVRHSAGTARVSGSAAGGRSAGGLPQYTPVCEEEGSDEIREEVMGRHADFFGTFDSHPPGENSEESVGTQGMAATEAKPTAWKEWKGQVIQQGFVAQRAYATQDRNVNEIIAEGYDARI